MTVAPMDYGDLNMIPVASEMTSADQSLKLPNSGALTGYVTNFNSGTTQTPPAVRFEFNVVVEYCATANMMSLVHSQVPYANTAQRDGALNSASDPTVWDIVNSVFKMGGDALNMFNKARYGIEGLMGNVNPSIMPSFMEGTHVDTVHGGSLTPDTNSKINVSNTGELKIESGARLTLPYSHETSNLMTGPTRLSRNQEESLNEVDDPGYRLLDQEPDVSEYFEIHGKHKGKTITLEKETYATATASTRPGNQNEAGISNRNTKKP